ncbi:MAG TPA: twin-arginine translocase subunit TatC [Anaerolineales bacterium]|nr:twin-arginine translocase subunit TatC [Anaerolineales bacterium]
MRRLLSRLWRLLTAPFRFLARPFRAVHRFLTFEPEDAPTGDVLARTLENPSGLLEHIEALRKHLTRSLIVLVITTGIGLALAPQILDFLAEPIGGIGSLQAIEVTESIGAFMRVSLLSGFALAFPYIAAELFAFAQPGLRRRERLLLLAAIPAGFVLFVGGMLFAFKVMLPTALPFLLTFMGIRTVPRPSNYINFVTSMLFWIGMAFEFPLIVYSLAAIGVVQARSLWRGWRIAIIAIGVLAAVITPTPDPVNMALVMAPMIVLYFLGVGLAALAGRGRRRRAQG